jgi:hypothetical protein
MALKDWRKWRGHSWIRKKDASILSIHHNKFYGKYYTLKGVSIDTIKVVGASKTKPQALKFAKSYMRRH